MTFNFKIQGFLLLLFVTLFSCLNEFNNKTEKATPLILKDTTPVKKKKNQISKAFVLGKFNYKTDTSFVVVDKKHALKTIYLKKETYAAFKTMHNAAKKDGITLTIISGTRNFYEQKAIWERKWQRYNNLKPLQRAKKILEYSAMPSTSRHHWGTDIDLNNLNNSYFNAGKGKAEYNWLIKHANNFGFYQVYTNKANGRTGYNIEQWHWSYLPLAQPYLEFYNAEIMVGDITGFKGSDLALKLNIITNYVNGIALKTKDNN